MIAQDEGFTEVKYNAVEALKETLMDTPAREGSRDCGFYLEKLQIVCLEHGADTEKLRSSRRSRQDQFLGARSTLYNIQRKPKWSPKCNKQYFYFGLYSIYRRDNGWM